MTDRTARQGNTRQLHIRFTKYTHKSNNEAARLAYESGDFFAFFGREMFTSRLLSLLATLTSSKSSE